MKVPELYRLRLADGYVQYAAMHRACGGRRGWSSARDASTSAADLGYPDATVEAYTPAPNVTGDCPCPP